MRVSDTSKNRGAHGDSSFKLDGMPSSSENPPALAVGSVKNNAKRYRQIPESEMRRMWTDFQYPEISEWKYWKSMIWYRNINNKGFQQMHMIRHI